MLLHLRVSAAQILVDHMADVLDFGLGDVHRHPRAIATAASIATTTATTTSMTEVDAAVAWKQSIRYAKLRPVCFKLNRTKK